MLEHLTKDDFKMMDKLLLFEYNHKEKSVREDYMFTKLGANREQVLYAARNIKTYVENFNPKFCKIQVYNSDQYAFLEFYPQETERLIKMGFEKAVRSVTEKNKIKWYKTTEAKITVFSVILSSILTYFITTKTNGDTPPAAIHDTVYIYDTIQIKQLPLMNKVDTLHR